MDRPCMVRINISHLKYNGLAKLHVGFLNELWRYRVNDSTWTWISGNDTADQQGVYGEKGQASVDNTPGGRSGAVGWFDSSKQEFWVLGGHRTGV